MKVFLLGIFSIALSIAGYTYGAGGKVNNPHIKVGDDGCAYVLGVTESCEIVPTPSQSGIKQYVCALTLVCPEDREDEEDGEDRKYPLR